MGVEMSHVISKDIEALHEGTMISIQAKIPSTPKRFSIDLVSQDESVAFHFNPRFDETTNVVVCNAWTPSRLWGKEERVTTVPFSPNTSFAMTITVKSCSYDVHVNGKHFLNFEHRIPYHTVQKVKFRGDVVFDTFSYTSVKDPPPYNSHENTTATQSKS